MDNADTKLLVVTTKNELLNINSVCRICANQDDKLIGIFSPEGVSNDMADKINSYLPINVTMDDSMPLQCCESCMTTILTWHELVLTSTQADLKFKNCHFYTEKILPEPNTTEERLIPHQSLNLFCQTNKTIEEVEVEEIAMFNSNNKKKNIIEEENEESYCITTIIDETNNEEDYKIDIDHHYPVKDDIGETSLNDESEDDPNDSSINNKDDDEYLACEFCPGILLMKEDYIKHFKKDHPQKKSSIKIESLQGNKKEQRKIFKLDQETTNAAKVEVDGKIYYNCNECGKSLHSPYTYAWHMRIHTGERPYVCDLCGKQFRVSQGLIRHLRETHQRIKKFPCDLCGRMFSTKRNVEEHRRIHTNERPYICDLCGKAFKQKASLFVHKRSHKNYFPYKCSYCNQGFRAKPPLKVHITRHTGEKPYKCDICGRCFRINYELKRHRLIHSDEKPFSCNLCGLSFRQKRYLKNHTKANHSTAT